MKPHHNGLELLLVSEACAFVFAIVFVITMTLSLPLTDGAHGQPPFADPLVLPVMSIFAGLAGLLAWPFVYLVLRRRRLRSCLPVILCLTLIWIVAVTPFHAGAGFLGSFGAFAVALLLCRRFIRICQPPGSCQRCGYDLTGNVSGRCPECGKPLSSTMNESGA